VAIPCTIRTLGSIAQGYGEHLVRRAANVVLEERRKLVLIARGRRYPKFIWRTC